MHVPADFVRSAKKRYKYAAFLSTEPVAETLSVLCRWEGIYIAVDIQSHLIKPRYWLGPERTACFVAEDGLTLWRRAYRFDNATEVVKYLGP